MSEFKKQSYYTDRYNNDSEFRGNTNLWALIVIFAVVIGFLFTLPTWADMLIDLNIGFWLIVASMEIYSHKYVRIFLFLVGFLNLVMGLAKLKDMIL
jgi:hypothetical protein